MTQKIVDEIVEYCVWGKSATSDRVRSTDGWAIGIKSKYNLIEKQNLHKERATGFELTVFELTPSRYRHAREPPFNELKRSEWSLVELKRSRTRRRRNWINYIVILCPKKTI